MRTKKAPTPVYNGVWVVEAYSLTRGHWVALNGAGYIKRAEAQAAVRGFWRGVYPDGEFRIVRYAARIPR